MAEVEVNVAGRLYSIACRDGGEDHLRNLASRVDAKADDARKAIGDTTEARLLLFSALLLADELSEQGGGAAVAPAASASAGNAGVDAAILSRIGDRLDRIAAQLELGNNHA